MLEAVYMEQLGFEKACALLWSEEEKGIFLTINIGYLQNEVEAIKSYVDSDKGRYLDLIKHQNTVSSISPTITAAT